MAKYAFIDAAGVCGGEGSYMPALDPVPDNAIPIGDDDSRLGQRWTGKKWVSVPKSSDVQPTIVLESITADHAHDTQTIVADTMSEVRTVVGATLTLAVRMDVAGQLYPVNESFDLPLSSSDGRVRPVRVMFEDGRALFPVAMTEARIWNVSQEMINSGLPPEKHMHFAGLRVVAAEI
ncbi:hypothetical protein [Comamonas koreensis]|uniref:Phage tail protein n=1 Tax=Comamonas koreensis TaxID=160825 RepID=A0AAW4XXD5_9BURK|nr:hypothetical protein [Comamonas koreensis]MCD2166827.1 hypothetical protein [Comamonas koreensis]